VLTAPLAYFIKPRLPYAATAHIKPFQLKFALSRTFFLHQVANIAQALGFFLPGIYLPSYARGIGASAFPSALTVLLVNVASVFGCILMGTLTDRLHVTTCLMISTLGTAVGTFLFWGFATNLPMLYIYCVCYGLFAGSYSTTWSGIMQEITSRPDPSLHSGPVSGGSSFDPIMVIGVLSAGRGIGNIVSGPLSEALSRGKPWQGQAFGGYGSGYGPLIIMTGATALVGGATFFWRRIGWM
jgi:MFS family permease